MGVDGKRATGVTKPITLLEPCSASGSIEILSTMAEMMGAVLTHDDVAFVAREAAAASKSCKVALPHLPWVPKKGRLSNF